MTPAQKASNDLAAHICILTLFVAQWGLWGTLAYVGIGLGVQSLKYAMILAINGRSGVAQEWIDCSR